MRVTHHDTWVRASRAAGEAMSCLEHQEGLGCTLVMDLLCHRMGWHLDPGTV